MLNFSSMIVTNQSSEATISSRPLLIHLPKSIYQISTLTSPQALVPLNLGSDRSRCKLHLRPAVRKISVVFSPKKVSFQPPPLCGVSGGFNLVDILMFLTQLLVNNFKPAVGRHQRTGAQPPPPQDRRIRGRVHQIRRCRFSLKSEVDIRKIISFCAWKNTTKSPSGISGVIFSSYSQAFLHFLANIFFVC